MTKTFNTNNNKFWDKESFKSIFKKSIPIILASMLNAFIPFVDNVFSGTIGDNSEAAVSYSLQINLTLWLFVLGAFGAIGVVMAQYWGAKKLEEANGAHKLKVIVGVAITAIGSLFVLLFTDEILGFFTNEQSIINEGRMFLKLYTAVFVLNSINTSYSGSLSTLGYTTISLISTIISISLNALLDYLFVNLWDMGTAGLAYATIIVQVVLLMTFVLYGKIKKQQVVSLGWLKLFKIKKEVIIKSLKRWHMLILEISFGMGLLIANIFMAQGYDSPIAYGAVQGVIAPFTSIIFSGIGGFYAAVAIFVGANLGRNKFELAYTNAKRVLVCSMSFVMFVSLVVCALSQNLVDIYVKVSPAVKEQSVMILRLYPLIIPGFLFGILSYRFLEAGGQSKTVAIFDFVNTWVVYLVGVYLIFVVWNPKDIWVAFIVSQTIRYFRAIVSFYLVRDKLWLVNLAEEEAKEPQGKTYFILSLATFGLYPIASKTLSLITRKK